MACCIFALAILIAPAAIAQNMVSGTVVDGQNEPVIGASVMVKGTTSGVQPASTVISPSPQSPPTY